MSLKETIKKDFIEAFRNKDLIKKSVLSMLNSEIKNAEIALIIRKEGLSDEKVLEVIKRSVKQRKDSIAKYTEGGRAELAVKEQAELDILKTYLPVELDSEKIRKVVEAVIKSSEARDMSQLGVVMGKVMQELEGEADGSVVREMVTKILQN